MSLISLLKSGRFAHLRSAAAEEPKDTTDESIDEKKLEDGDESETDAESKKAKKARKAKKAEGDDNSSDLDGKDLDDDEDDDEDEDNEDTPEGKKARKAKKAEDEDESDAKAAFRRGRMAERERCAAIFASRAGVLRPDMAAEIAFSSGMSVEKATVFLDRAVAKVAPARLADRMATVQVANPGTEGGENLDPSDPKALVQMAIAAAAKARGR